MKYIKSSSLLSLLILFAAPIPTTYSMGNYDFDQMQNLQQELEEANKAIEEYISSLSDDEQAEFNKAVDEISQMFDNMSEEEFASFLNEMFTEEPMGLPTESFSQTPQQAPVETPALTSEQKKKVENVITVINDVIRQSNILLVQINSSLEASKNIDSWSKKGLISYWQPNAEWKDLKLDIEKFVQQLYKMEDKDLTAQEYKYILDLIADEATLNNLIQLQTNLNSSVPQIEISELDIKKLSSQAKTAIKDALAHYTEALYVLQIPKAFDAIFEKFGSKAEKYREAEEAAEKKAVEGAKRQRTPIGATTAGVSSESGYDSGYGGYGGYDYGNYGSDYGGYGGYDYGSYGGDYGGYGGYSGGESSGKESKGGGGGMGGGGRSSGGGSAETPSTEQKQPVTPGVAASYTKDPIAKNHISNIKTSIKNVAKIIEDDSLFARLDEHIKGAEETTDKATADPVNTDLANEIEKLDKEIKALEQEIQTLQSRMLKMNPATQAHYNQSLSAAITKPMETIKTLKSTLEKIDFKKIKNKQAPFNKITPEKEWAYFNGDEKLLEKIKKTEAGAPEKAQELLEKVPVRVSLADLAETITKFETAVNTLKEKTKPKATTIVPANIPAAPVAPVTTLTEPV